ncbi:protein of unknown function [Ruminococcaceae bacterium BL-6]|nr:protein of unknown function [Ruminococcaceae bacterium BL-6]
MFFKGRYAIILSNLSNPERGTGALFRGRRRLEPGSGKRGDRPPVSRVAGCPALRG